jgi:hypothetical protein
MRLGLQFVIAEFPELGEMGVEKDKPTVRTKNSDAILDGIESRALNLDKQLERGF